MYPPRVQTQRASLPAQQADGAIRAHFGRCSAGRTSLLYPPSGWRPEANDSKLPDCALRREYVYGYNGACKQSLHFISAEECIYPVAALVVIQSLADVGQQRFFEGHSRTVQCLAWNERRGICASGQTDPKGSVGAYICVWSPQYCDRTISELHHHERQVTAVALSPDGQLAVSFGGDDAHSFCIWRDFASWDGTKAPDQNLAGFSTEPEKKAPIYTCSSGRTIMRSICMGPWLRAEQAERQQQTVIFYTTGEGSEGGHQMSGLFKFWTVRLRSRGEEPDVSQKRGVFGKSPTPRIMTSIAYAEDQASAFLVGDNGHLYTLREGSATQDRRIVPRGSKASLGVVTAIPGGRWLAGSNDGMIYIGSCDPRVVVQVQLSITELLGPEGELFSTTAMARFSAAAVHGDRLLLGTSNDALMLADLDHRAAGQVLQVSHSAEAWALDFHPSLAILVTASCAKDIRFWNIAERRPAVGKVVRLQNDVWSVAFNPEGSLLAAGCGRGVLELLAFPTLQPVVRKILSRDNERITSLCFSSNGSWLAAACWDQVVYLLKVVPTRATKPGDVASHSVTLHKALTGNSSSPVCIMFSGDGEHIMSNSKDSQILFWRTKDGTLQNSISQFRNTVWQQPWTCVLGWPVLGVWDRDYDQTDVNSLCQSYAPHDGYVAIGDDFGKLKLFRFPCPFVDQPCRAYGGFGSHVTAVKFSSSNILVALGGDDRTVSQWSLDFSRRAPRRNLEPEPIEHPWVQLEEAQGGPRDDFGFLGRPRASSVPRPRRNVENDNVTVGRLTDDALSSHNAELEKSRGCAQKEAQIPVRPSRPQRPVDLHSSNGSHRPHSASRRTSAKVAPRRASSAVGPRARRESPVPQPPTPTPQPEDVRKPLRPPSALAAALPPRDPVVPGNGYYRNQSRGVSSALSWDQWE
mmetsp:Transcript_105595/g.166617  ORF Transcript_105595/g.166617 Transcript_105595/m.166617 type:complete len:917 (+) Transcript_105595:120-2870(+)